MSKRYDGVHLYKLVDKETDLSVTISPNEGGQVADLVFKGQNILTCGRGAPPLFPWPNRIRDARFSFRGKEVKLVPTTRDGLAIHGLVMRKSWKVEEENITEKEARLTISIRSVDFKDIVEQFPYPFKFTLDYILRDGTLEIRATAVNEGKEIMPMGFGMHTNFRVPFGEKGIREDCLVMVPADSHWELASDRPVPSGRKLSVDGTKYDLRKPTHLKGVTFDDNMTDLIREENGWVTAKIYDHFVDITMFESADSNFKYFQVYAPPDRNMMCIQPYTCTIDAFNLESRGIDAGAIALEPGKTWTGAIRWTPKAGKLI